MRRVVRTGGLTGTWLALTVVVTLAAMALAVRAPGPARIGLEAAIGGGAFFDGAQRFAPVDARILGSSLTPEAIRRLLGTTPSGSGEQREDAAAPPDEGFVERPPGLTRPGELTKDPDVRVEMTADRADARPGDTITYTITVTNFGKGAAKEVNVSSHIPEHTTYVNDDSCGDAPVSVTPNQNVPGGYSIGICAPGPPAPGLHGYTSTYGPLNPGRRVIDVFRVVVNPDAPNGFVLRNHAHVMGPGMPRRTSNEVVTKVTVS